MSNVFDGDAIPITLATGEWPCAACTFINVPSALRCAMCEGLRPSARVAQHSIGEAANEADAATTTTTTTATSATATTASSSSSLDAATSPALPPPSSSGVVVVVPPGKRQRTDPGPQTDNEEWSCAACTLRNPPSAIRCEACEGLRWVMPEGVELPELASLRRREARRAALRSDSNDGAQTVRPAEVWSDLPSAPDGHLMRRSAKDDDVDIFGGDADEEISAPTETSIAEAATPAATAATTATSTQSAHPNSSNSNKNNDSNNKGLHTTDSIVGTQPVTAEVVSQSVATAGHSPLQQHAEASQQQLQQQQQQQQERKQEQHEQQQQQQCSAAALHNSDGTHNDKEEAISGPSKEPSNLPRWGPGEGPLFPSVLVGRLAEDIRDRALLEEVEFFEDAACRLASMGFDLGKCRRALEAAGGDEVRAREYLLREL